MLRKVLQGNKPHYEVARELGVGRSNFRCSALYVKRMSGILKKLQGGDLRSIGRANEVALKVERDKSLFAELINCLDKNDPVTRMRSADVIENPPMCLPLSMLRQICSVDPDNSFVQ